MPPGPGSSGPLPRRDEDGTRALLLNAASEVLAEAGLDASMEAIAARAGVQIGAARECFGSKGALLDALVETRIRQFVDLADQALTCPDPWQGIVVYVEGAMELHTSNPRLRELVFGTPRSREVYLKQAQQILWPRLEEIASRAHREGVLRPSVEASDLAIVQLMLTSVSTGNQGDRIWRRFLPVVLNSLRSNESGPLPGDALTREELDAFIASLVPADPAD